MSPLGSWLTCRKSVEATTAVVKLGTSHLSHVWNNRFTFIIDKRPLVDQWGPVTTMGKFVVIRTDKVGMLTLHSFAVTVGEGPGIHLAWGPVSFLLSLFNLLLLFYPIPISPRPTVGQPTPLATYLILIIIYTPLLSLQLTPHLLRWHTKSPDNLPTSPVYLYGSHHFKIIDNNFTIVYKS